MGNCHQPISFVHSRIPNKLNVFNSMKLSTTKSFQKHCDGLQDGKITAESVVSASQEYQHCNLGLQCLVRGDAINKVYQYLSLGKEGGEDL